MGCRLATSVAGVAALLSGSGCFDPDFPSGVIQCGADRSCPGDLVCDTATDLCVRELGPAAADGAPDGIAADGSTGAGADAGVATSFCDPDERDLIACYEFEGDVSDGSSYENHGQATNVEFVAGYDGLGMRRLDEEGQVQVHVPESGSLLALKRVTVEVWMSPSALPSARESVILDKTGQLGVGITPDAEPLAWLTDQGGQEHVLTGPGPLSTESWTHFALTFDGEDFRFYIDGELHVLAEVPLSLGPGTGQGMSILHEYPAGSPFVGLIDRLRIWKSARTDSEICAEAGC